MAALFASAPAVTDRDLLSHMTKRVKNLLGVDDLEVLADMDY